MRLDGSCTAFGVGGLHAKEHELRALHGAPFGAGTDANAFVEGLRFEPEPLALDRLDVLKAPDEHHIVSGARQLEAVVAAHRTRTHYRDSSHWIMRVRELLISACHVDHPFKTTLPNGRSSIRWRKAAPASGRA